MSQLTSKQTSPRTESWENEGGSVPGSAPESPDSLAEALGITREINETYSVGGYHYTNLTDAIAQARRMTKLDGERS
jgi:hypothetical protein